MDIQELTFRINGLRNNYGASLPIEVLSENYKLLTEFKDIQVKQNWLDDNLIWVCANIDRYNGHTFGT